MSRGLDKAIRDIRRAIDETLAIRNTPDTLLQRLAERPRLAIVGSGNSAYAARYLEWLLRVEGLAAEFFSPLQYALVPPGNEHVCLLVSQGAYRGDSQAIAQIAARRQAPLFVLCSSRALEGDTVAAQVAGKCGPGHIFSTSSLSDRGFVSVTGTAAAFVGAYQIAAGIFDKLPRPLPELSWDLLLSENEQQSISALQPIVLYGPAGRAAAEAFAGYHSESLGPVAAYDMKNFTHGVWRGLREAGRHCVYFVSDRQVRPLREFLVAKLGEDHETRVVEAGDAHWAVEPLVLFVKMVRSWATLCRNLSSTRPHWSPLHIDMTEWPKYAQINSGFDLLQIVEEKGPP